MNEMSEFKGVGLTGVGKTRVDSIIQTISKIIKIIPKKFNEIYLSL